MSTIYDEALDKLVKAIYECKGTITDDMLDAMFDLGELREKEVSKKDD